MAVVRIKQGLFSMIWQWQLNQVFEIEKKTERFDVVLSFHVTLLEIFWLSPSVYL